MPSAVLGFFALFLRLGRAVPRLRSGLVTAEP